jgi:histidine triad (HIT) family protein
MGRRDDPSRMSADCIFCSIVDGDIPARTVHETDDVLAFLDANPLAPGHTLVIPKAHAQHVGDLDDDLASDLFATVTELTPRVQAAVDAEGANVGINDGEAAGQEVPHVHVHIIPRFEGDGGAPLHAVGGKRPDLSEEELDAIADDVAAAIDG